MIKINNKIAISVATSIALGVSAYGACSANLDMNNKQIKNLAAPTDNNDSVTLEYMKDYIDSAIVAMGPGYVEDSDGNIYHTKVFGSQVWMTDNLRATTSPTGVATNVRECNTAEWSDNGDTCYAAASADGDTPDDKADLNVSKGYLYQWNAAMDGNTTEGARGLCPAGWHIPTDQDWQTLEDTLSKHGKVGPQMQSDTMMNALMVGIRSAGGTQNSSGIGTRFWSSTKANANSIIWRLNDGDENLTKTSNDRSVGISIRCVKD